MMPRRAGPVALLVAVLGMAWPDIGVAAEPALLSLSVGVAGPVEPGERAAEFGLEYSPALAWWLVRPKVGLLATADGAAYGYGGIALDLPLSAHLMVTAGTALGAYRRGGGVDLGHWLMFRSGVEAAWRWADASRLGLGLYHMSNAGLDDRNPGQQSVVLTYTLPLSRR